MKDIVTVAEENGLEMKKEGSILRAHCPFHSDTDTPNFTIYAETDSWFCFRCNEGGDTIAFVAKIKGISRSDAKMLLQNTQVDMEELKEEIDGLDSEPAVLIYNKEVNILVSKMCRQTLQAHPEKEEEIFKILKNLDQQLLQPITKEKMDEIRQDITQKLFNHE